MSVTGQNHRFRGVCLQIRLQVLSFANWPFAILSPWREIGKVCVSTFDCILLPMSGNSLARFPLTRENGCLTIE
jgi:hypothetical protein